MTVKDSSFAVPNLEHEQLNFEWGDVQLFLLVAQSGSLRAASRRANRSVNSLRRRLQNLEHRLSCRLLIRDASGTHLTEQGQRLLDAGKSMYEASHVVADEFIKADRKHAQTVSVDIEETLANFWLMPLMVDFQGSHPACQLDLRCDLGSLGSGTSWCDVTVRTDVPSENSLMVTRLGYLHFQPFASREFIARHGRPTNPDDLVNFALVDRVLVNSNTVSWVSCIPTRVDLHIAFLTNTDAAQISAVAQGVGIGILPTYLADADDRFVPLLDSLRCCRDIYLTYRRDVADHRQVRVVIDWLKSIFDAGHSPWFLEEYVAPTDTALWQV